MQVCSLRHLCLPPLPLPSLLYATSITILVTCPAVFRTVFAYVPPCAFFSPPFHTSRGGAASHPDEHARTRTRTTHHEEHQHGVIIIRNCATARMQKQKNKNKRTRTTGATTERHSPSSAPPPHHIITIYLYASPSPQKRNARTRYPSLADRHTALQPLKGGAGRWGARNAHRTYNEGEEGRRDARTHARTHACAEGGRWVVHT